MAEYNFQLTVIVADSGCISCDDLDTAVGRVVSPFALLAIVVTDVVRVLLVKLHRINIAQRLLVIALALCMCAHTLCVYVRPLNLTKP